MDQHERDDLEEWIGELRRDREAAHRRRTKAKRDFQREHEAARRAGKMYRNAWRRHR